ncbi:MAG: HEAT repeat domain-containing protein [Desulfococcaceae bacterium]
MLSAQLAATIQVGLSNRALAEKMAFLAAQGYRTAPGGAALPVLLSPAAAMGGGLFFTITLGAFLTLFSVLAGVAWHRFYGGGRGFLLVCLLFWAALFWLINADGFAGLDNLHLSLTPPLSFILAARRAKGARNPDGGLGRIGVHAACLVVLATAGTTMVDAELFSRIRDRLLNHPAGVAVSGFYYRYTLYPAETFKAPAQKQIGAVRLDPALPDELARRLGASLALRDYLPVTSEGPVDISVQGDEDRLRMMRNGALVMEIPVSQFFRDPQAALKDFSRRVDRHGGLRQLTFLSLQLVWGVLLYGLLFLPMRFLAGYFLDPSRAATAGGALACGVALLLPMTLQHAPVARVAPDKVQESLSSPDSADRLAALRFIYHRGIEIAGFENFESLAASPRAAERFWLAKALRHSRSRISWPVHLALLEDPQINVAYNAFWSLGFRRDSRGVPEILRRIDEDPRWYVQWYAYRALRRLGWRQRPTSP